MVTNGLVPTHYTPLESLLFFQSLRAQDITSIDFAKISDELVTIPLVKNDATFDRHRLSPDALQHLYSSLIKEEEEGRDDTDDNENDKIIQPQQNGDLSSPSRKRKAASPSLPSVQAAAKHLHLFPRLVTKLYARYRDNIVATIKQEEAEIDRLDREIQQIEQGQFDEKLKLENGDPTPSSADGRGPTPNVNGVDPTHANERPRSSRASIDALVNHTPEPDATRPATQGRRTSANPPGGGTKPPLPPLSEMAPEQLVGPHVPPRPRSIASQSPNQQHGPIPPVYSASPPVKHSSPYMQQYPLPAPSPPSQHLALSQSPTSPQRVLAVPAGMKGQPAVNGFQPPPPPHGQAPMQPPHYGSPSQIRSSPAPMPVPIPPGGRGYAHPQQLYQYPQYQQYPGQQQQPPHYVQHQQPHQPQQAPYQVRPSQQGGFQLPPFQVSAQDPSKLRHQYPNQRATPQPSRQHQAQIPPQSPASAHSPYAQYSPFPQTPHPQPRLSLDSQRLTNSVVASLRRPRSLSTWKTQGVPALKPPRSPSQPAAEPLSPTRPLVEPIGNDQAVSSPPPDETKPTKQDRIPKQSKRKTRGSSVASSNIASSTRGRTRSQSIMSHTDAPSADVIEVRTRGALKADPFTPRESTSDPLETSAGRNTRTRRSTLQPPSYNVRPSPRGTPGPSAHKHAEQRRDVVYATRNFSRLSTVILNEIFAHRHAGPFQRPVTEREAEGYNDIIRRPQDLKSIKAAISAGSRAVNAALAAKEAGTDGEDGDEPLGQGGGSHIVLPKTEDLIPPKGIVNSAQLEKEVMRTFANAVMFNPGDEGFVTDAREMAEDVARKIGDWRGVETQQGDGEQGSVKRRKA